MNIEHKKTALDDDSLLYQKRDDSLGKKNLSGLSSKEKAGYFKDYYLVKLLVVLAVIAIAGYLIYTMFFRHVENILNVAVIGDCYLSESDELTEMLREHYGLTSEDQILTVTNYELTDTYQQMAFTTKLAAQDIDIILCDSEQFETYCNQGVFADLSDILPEETHDALSEAGAIVTGHTTETDYDGNITSTGEETEYGITVSDSALYSAYGGNGTAILGFAANTQRQENALIFLDLVQDWEPTEETETGTEG